ncbi:isochorismate synthase, partial [Mycobacterium palustre]|nr:isochorismate synthase [Mycobacterium palustre]
MSAQPPFALCGPTGTLVAEGVRAQFSDVRSAQAALRSGSAPIVLGALPFDVDRPAALLVPGAVRSTDRAPDWPTDPLPAVRVVARTGRPTGRRTRCPPCASWP